MKKVFTFITVGALALSLMACSATQEATANFENTLQGIVTATGSEVLVKPLRTNEVAYETLLIKSTANVLEGDIVSLSYNNINSEKVKEGSLEKVEVATFKATIISIDGSTAIVTPLENETYILSSGDQVRIPLPQALNIKIGDEVTVEYDGRIMESYPLGVNTFSVNGIEVEKEEPNNTGNLNDAVGITSDGEIIEIPYVENTEGGANEIEGVPVVEEEEKGTADIGNDVSIEKDNVSSEKLDLEVENDPTAYKNNFKATIISIDGNRAIVEPLATETHILSSGDQVYITLPNNFSAKVGSEVSVVFDGDIMESYPLRVNTVSVNGIEVEKVKSDVNIDPNGHTSASNNN